MWEQNRTWRFTPRKQTNTQTCIQPLKYTLPTQTLTERGSVASFSGAQLKGDERKRKRRGSKKFNLIIIIISNFLAYECLFLFATEMEVISAIIILLYAHFIVYGVWCHSFQTPSPSREFLRLNSSQFPLDNGYTFAMLHTFHMF